MMMDPAPDTRDRDVRPRLIASIEGASWMREECWFSTNSRIDVAAIVAGVVHGYEIKAARDSLRRLVPPHGFQASEFSAVYDRVTLVCAACHVGEALSMVPPWWRVVRADDLSEVRPGGPNPGAAVPRLAGLFWHGELRSVAATLGLPYRRLDKRALIDSFRPEHEAALREALPLALGARVWRKPVRRAKEPARAPQSLAGASASERRVRSLAEVTYRLAHVALDVDAEDGKTWVTVLGEVPPMRGTTVVVRVGHQSAGTAWKMAARRVEREAEAVAASALRRADSLLSDAARHRAKGTRILDALRAPP